MAFGVASCSASTDLDHLYSVAALTDADGNVVEHYRYDAYGDMTVEDVDGDGKGKRSGHKRSGHALIATISGLTF